MSSPARSLVHTRGCKATHEYTISIQSKDDKTDVIYLVLNNREEKVTFEMRFNAQKTLIFTGSLALSPSRSSRPGRTELRNAV